MLSKRDNSKGYVFVKAKDEEKRQARIARKKAKRDVKQARRAYDKARKQSFVTVQDVKDRAIESAQRRAQRMLPPAEPPTDEELKPKVLDEEAQAKFIADSKKRLDEARQKQGKPSFAEEKEARKVRVDEKAKPAEEDDTPRHKKIDNQRMHEVFDALKSAYEENISFGATPEEALNDISQMLGEAFVESLPGIDSYEFMLAHQKEPIITPAMSAFLIDKANENGLDASNYDATVKDEQIAHHLGLLNPYKILRPDKVMEALDWHSGQRGDEEDIHPLLKVASDLYEQGVAKGAFSPQEADEQQAERNENRAIREADARRARNRASRGFTDVPPYDVRDESPRGGSPHSVALDDAYRQFFEEANLQQDGDEELDFKSNNFTHDAIIDVIKDTVRRSMEGDRDVGGERQEDQQQKIVRAYQRLQDSINKHAQQTLNATSIGARQKLEFGRPQESGSDPIMTPTWKKVAKTLGIATPIKVNAPDALLMGPLAGMKAFGGNAISPYDPNYRETIATAIGEYADRKGVEDYKKFLHPAIKTNTQLMSEALIPYGLVDDAREFGFAADEKDRQGELKDEEIQVGSRGIDEPGALGTPMGNLDALSGKNKEGLLFGKTKEELASMGKAARKQYVIDRTKANKAAMKRFLRTGKKYDAIAGKGLDQDALAQLEHQQMMNEVEHYRQMLNNNRISREEYDKRVGDIIAQKGLGREDIDLTEAQQVSIPDVPEGHYLYADKDGNELSSFEREEKLKKFMNTVVGTHHILQSAKRKMKKEGEDPSLIHNEKDLLMLLSPPSKRYGRGLIGPRTKPTEEELKIDAMRASNLDSQWLRTRLSQNNELRENIRELGITPLKFLEQIGEVFGDGFDYDNLNAGVVKMMDKMGQHQRKGEFNDALNRMLYSYLDKRHTKDMKDINHHTKAKTQHKELRDGKIKEECMCANCIGSPERTGNVGENRGGKGRMTSPYLYDLMKVPNLMGLELGELATEDNPDPIGRGTEPNLANIYHELKGRGDDEKQWAQTDGELRSIGNPKFIKQICERMAAKRTPGMTEDLSQKYGVGSRWIQAMPKGVAHDIEANPLAAEVWKHAYPSLSGAEKRSAQQDLQDMEKEQKKDLIGAFNLLSMTSKKITAPQLFDGELSSKAKRKMIKEIINLSGNKQQGMAQSKLDRYMKGKIQRRDGVEDKKIPGFNDKMVLWNRLNIPKILENREKIEALEGNEKKADELAKMKAENKKLIDKATIYCKNNPDIVRFSSQIQRYNKAIEEKGKLEDALAEAKAAVKFSLNNAHMATLANLYPQMSALLKEHGDKPELGKLQTALDALHDSEYKNNNGVNLRFRHGYKMAQDGGIKTPRRQEMSPLDVEGGLRGRLGETLGSAVNYSGNGYHVPIPDDLDTALAMLKDKGVTVTQEILDDLKNADEMRKQMKVVDDEFAHMGEHMSEADKAKANRSYTHPNRQNYSNPTGSLSRCGTCGGNTHINQDELISYAKAHHEELQGHSASSKAMRRWISQHARPAGYQSFEDYDAKNSCELGPMNHGEYACPDCQHWDSQVKGYVSDGVCGQCLGRGMLDPNDEHLIEQISHHPHKAGVAMDPEKLGRVLHKERVDAHSKPIDFGITDPARLLGEAGATFPPPEPQPSLEGVSPMSSNIIDEMFGDTGLSGLDLMLERINDGELPNIHTREELEAAKKRAKDATRNASIIDELKSGEQPMDFDDVFEEKPTGQMKLPLVQGDSPALKMAWHKEGQKAVNKQLQSIMRVAKNYGLGDVFMTDENGKPTNQSVYNAMVQKANALLEHKYADFEDEEHEVHDKFDALQKMLHNNIAMTPKQKQALGSNTEMYKKIEAMEDGEEKDKAMKKYMKSLYKNPTWTTPLLTHHAGRTVTPWELKHRSAFDNNEGWVHDKSPQAVYDFFAGNKRAANRIRSAFEMANGNEWDFIKEEEDKQIMDFLKDMDSVLEAGESPLQQSRKGVIKPNSQYLELKQGLNQGVPDDEYTKALPEGNVLHPNLEKHSKNAQNWLRPAARKTNEDGEVYWEVKPRHDALHMRIPNEISKIAKREFGEMAKMRAIMSFFNLQSNPEVKHMPDGADGTPMERILNADGNPMTLDEYKDANLTREQQSQLDNAIKAMVVDKNGNPIEDFEDKTGKGQLKSYHIVNRFPHPEAMNQSLMLQEHNFDDYLSERMNDADLKAQPHESKNFASKVFDFIRKNQEGRAFKHNEKHDMSYDDAMKIVENANKFYDMYHFPNLYLENKLHDYAELYGLDSMKDMKELLAADPTIMRDFEEDTNMIRAIHPTWSPLNVGLQESIDRARQLKIKAMERFGKDGLRGIQTRLPTAQGFANLMNMGPSQFRQELEDATEQHLGLREQQQIAAQRPGQTELNVEGQDFSTQQDQYGQVLNPRNVAVVSQPTTDEAGQPTGFVQVAPGYQRNE